MLSFRAYFETEYKGPGTMFDNQGIPRHLMKTVISGDIFMLGNETNGQVKINGKTYSAPLPVRIDVDDDNFHADENGNFHRGTLVIMANQLPTQTNKVGKEIGGSMVQNPNDVGEEKVVINAEQLKNLLTVGMQQAAQNPMGGGMGGMGMGGMGGF